MKILKSDGKKEQLIAEEMGLTDKAERRTENKGKPSRVQDEKSETLCVNDGCSEPKAPGQTYVCAKHIRSN